MRSRSRAPYCSCQAIGPAGSPRPSHPARLHVAQWLTGASSAVVRINAVDTPWFTEDLAALRGSACTVMLSKASADGVAAVVDSLGEQTRVQAGCTTDLKINPQMQLAAQWHTDDVLNNRGLYADVGSDGSRPQDRANAAGFHGKVAETVAINPALAISGIELINQWYYNPAYMAIMQDCANSLIGVWSANSLDRTVVVAVYGQPA